MSDVLAIYMCDVLFTWQECRLWTRPRPRGCLYINAWNISINRSNEAPNKTLCTIHSHGDRDYKQAHFLDLHVPEAINKFVDFPNNFWTVCHNFELQIGFQTFSTRLFETGMQYFKHLRWAVAMITGSEAPRIRTILHFSKDDNVLL